MISVFTHHLASNYANFFEQKKKQVFTLGKDLTPTGLVWDTNMAILHFQRHLFHPVQNLLFLNVSVLLSIERRMRFLMLGRSVGLEKKTN